MCIFCDSFELMFATLEVGGPEPSFGAAMSLVRDPEGDEVRFIAGLEASQRTQLATFAVHLEILANRLKMAAIHVKKQSGDLDLGDTLAMLNAMALQANGMDPMLAHVLADYLRPAPDPNVN